MQITAKEMYDKGRKDALDEFIKLINISIDKYNGWTSKELVLKELLEELRKRKDSPQNETARSRIKSTDTTSHEVRAHALKSKSNKRDDSSVDISLCKACNCMTKTKKGTIYICGKCGKDRRTGDGNGKS